MPPELRMFSLLKARRELRYSKVAWCTFGTSIFFKPDHWFDSLMYRSCFSYHSGKLYENMIKALCF